MKPSIFPPEKRQSLSKITTACCLILVTCVNLFAQYKGAPVKKARLIQAIRSRQLQTSDIVSIINSNGVDFRLTPEIRSTLIAAGARPEIIQAVINNPRLALKNNSVLAKTEKNGANRRARPALLSYDEMLDQAIYSFKDQRNPKNAVRILETAAKAEPHNPEAFQMLGFIKLYGLKNPAQAEESMRKSVMNGGSAVFRVYHDDNGNFISRCTGSLYISQDTMRFESDDNVHTFETSTANIDKIKLDTESTRIWKKHSIFKLFLKFGKEKAKFRFAPLTGEKQESEMVERFIAATGTNKTPSVFGLISFR